MGSGIGQAADIKWADYGKFMVVTALTMVMYICIMQQAYAGTPMGDVLCTILGWMWGNLGRGLATLGICVIGTAAVMGKASWGLAATVAVGIAVLFGAAGVVDALGIGAASC